MLQCFHFSFSLHYSKNIGANNNCLIFLVLKLQKRALWRNLSSESTTAHVITILVNHPCCYNHISVELITPRYTFTLYLIIFFRKLDFLPRFAHAASMNSFFEYVRQENNFYVFVETSSSIT